MGTGWNTMLCNKGNQGYCSNTTMGMEAHYYNGNQATVGTNAINGTHGYTTRGTKAIVGIHCCNNGKKSLLGHTVTVRTKVIAGSQQ
jgi:hypothetical protein